MKKEYLIIGVVGLVAGLVIGFMLANNINRSASGQLSNTAASTTSAPTNNPNLPADHPPIGTAADQTQSNPLPQVEAAIDKARSEPKDYEAQMTAGDLYYQIGRFDEAAKFYEIANKLKPAESEPMIKAGNSYFDSEKFEQAEKWYLLALQKEPKNLNVRNDLGLTFFLRSPRNIERAIKEYKSSLSVEPDHEISLQNLAVAYKENGDQENLRATIEKLKKVNPNNPVVLKDEGK